jgi:hypothetical protein
MSIYFVDPTNGSNDNDGLTPAAAFASLKEGLGAADNVSIFYIRRDTTFPAPVNGFVQWFDARQWPEAGDDNYDTRPQEGIDAGWDADASIKPEMKVDSGTSFTWESANAGTGKADFYGVDIEFISTSESILFAGYALSSHLKNVDIRGDQSGMRLYKYFGADTNDTNGVVELENVNIDNQSYDTHEDGSYHSIMMYYNSSGDLRYDKKFILRNSTVKGIKNLGYFHKTDEANNTFIEIYDSTVEIGSYGISYEGPYYSDGTTSFIDVKVTGSSLITPSGANLFTLSQTERYGTNFALYARSSTFVAPNAIILSNDIYNSTLSLNRLGVIDIQGCTLDAQQLINVPTTTVSVFIDNITVLDCTLRHMSSVLFFGSTSTLHQNGGIVLSRNQYDEVTNVIHSETLDFSQVKVSMFGQQIIGQIFSGHIIDSVVSITDCSIGGVLPSTSSSNIDVFVTASSIDGLKGSNTTATIRGSLIQPSSSSCAISAGVTATFVECHVIAENAMIIEEGGIATFSSSNISEDEPSEGLYTVINSKYNDDMVEIKEVFKYFTMMSVSGARDGATKAFRLSENANNVSKYDGVVSNAVLIYNGTDTTATAYMLFNSIENADSAEVFFQAIDNGVLKTLSATVEDDDGVWGEYDAATIKKKATVDLTGLAIPTDSRIRFFCLITGVGDGTRYVIVDSVIVGV